MAKNQKTLQSKPGTGSFQDLHKGLRKFFYVPLLTTLVFPLTGGALSFIYPSFSVSLGVRANLLVISTLFLLLMGVRAGSNMGMVDLSKKESVCLDKAAKIYPFLLITPILFIAIDLMNQLTEQLAFNIASYATFAFCSFFAFRIFRLPMVTTSK